MQTEKLSLPMAHIMVLPVQQALARVMAEGRLRNKETRRPENDRGGQDENFRIDYFGSLAEICLYSWLEAQGELLCYHLVTKYVQRRADLILRNQTFDVKSIPPGKTFLTINARQHRGRYCDFYWPVTFLSEQAIHIHYPLPWRRVNDFDLMNNRHSPYYSAPLDTLRKHDGEVQAACAAGEGSVLGRWFAEKKNEKESPLPLAA